jgi:Arc/MetJ family transcription regulator
MAVTQIDVDEEALDEAMRLSGERTKKGMVNRALREFAERHRRIAALERHAAHARTWDHEGWRQLRDADKRPAG